MAAPPPKNDELVPNLNNYVRGKLSKSEVLTFTDCARALGEMLVVVRVQALDQSVHQKIHDVSWIVP